MCYTAASKSLREGERGHTHWSLAFRLETISWCGLRLYVWFKNEINNLLFVCTHTPGSVLFDYISCYLRAFYFIYSMRHFPLTRQSGDHEDAPFVSSLSSSPPLLFRLILFLTQCSAAVCTANKLSAVARWWSKSTIIPLLGNCDLFMSLSLVCLGGPLAVMCQIQYQ